MAGQLSLSPSDMNNKFIKPLINQLLPDEIMQVILQFCQCVDLIMLMRTCQYYYQQIKQWIPFIRLRIRTYSSVTCCGIYHKNPYHAFLPASTTIAELNSKSLKTVMGNGLGFGPLYLFAPLYDEEGFDQPDEQKEKKKRELRAKTLSQVGLKNNDVLQEVPCHPIYNERCEKWVCRLSMDLRFLS